MLEWWTKNFASCQLGDERSHPGERSSDCHDICGTGTFPTFADFVFYFLTLIENSIATALNFRSMNKEIFASIVLKNKAETFLGIKKLNYTCTHDVFFH